MGQFLTCGPNELVVVSGFGRSRPAMITGGSVLYFPSLQKAQILSLNVMSIKISTNDVYTSQGVLISVTGITQVKISTKDLEVLERACSHFITKTRTDIINLIKETMEGHQRSVVSMMTVEDIYKHRQAFNNHVKETALKDMTNLGLEILSYTIHDVSDNLEYLTSLGKARTAEIHRDARIGEAVARRDAEIAQSLAKEKLMEAQYTNKSLIAQAEKDFMCKKEAYDTEVFAERALADYALELQRSKAQQRNKEEKAEILVVDKRERVKLEEQEILCREKQLESTIKQVADAEKFRLKVIATAEKNKTILEADAEAEARRLKGDAEAFVIDKKAKAEAQVMNSKAEAWKEYQDAAILSIYLDNMPAVIHHVGSNLSKTKSVKMVSTGEAGVGALKLVNEVIDISSNIPSIVKNMTGIDLPKVAIH